MAYVPNLIPVHSRVNIDFSKEQKSRAKKASTLPELVVGVLFILIGFVYLFSRLYFAIPLLVVGLSILPYNKELIEKAFQFRLTQKLQLGFSAGLITIGSLFLPHYIKKENIALLEEQRALEKERTISLHQSKIKAQENIFLSKYSFVKIEEYKEWKAIAKDSTIDPKLKQENFLKERKKKHMLHQIELERQVNIEKQKRIKQEKEAFKLAQKEEREEQREIRRQERAYEAANTYNGHTIYTGPRGGRYYINSNGNKTYIPR